MPISTQKTLASSAAKKSIPPRMKVFTVGLDQKAPIDQTKIPDVPPPGYPGGEKSPSTTLPMGPEATPIFVKKSKGYKGVLVCMLAVFLIGLFALTLSEIAYNRQRDENFFRLRWAELKHKMGYDYANAAERIYTLRRQQEIEQSPIVPQNLQSPSTTTTVNSPIIDSSVEKESNKDNETPASTMNERLSFFKKLLEGIKKHAEDMGFDGTMQVSVLQVDPESLQQQLRERLQQARNHESDESSNMDGFGEWAMPQALLQQQQQQNENNNKNNRFGGFRFDDDYSGDFEAAAQQAREQQERQQRFRGFGNQWQPQSFDHWTANRVETPFFPPRPFWWQQQQQQQQRPQTPFFFQQGPMPQQQQQSFIQNEMFQQQQQVPQQLQQQQQQQFPQHLQFPQNQEPQVIFFPDHNINQFQQQQVPPQQQQLPEMNMFQHPRENAFIPPEDRIQIEPPSTPEQLNRWRMNNQKPFDFKSNEGPRGWTHQQQQQQENQDAFVQPPPSPPQPQAAAVMAPPLRFGPAFAVPQQNALPVNGVPTEPKKWENIQPLPAISIDSVSEPLPSWAIENSLESETPFAEIAQDEENLSHELSQNSIVTSGDAAIPRPPSIQPDENESHLHILPIKEVEGEKEHSGEVKIEKAPINDEPEAASAVVAKEPEPIEVDFPAVKFPISDDADRQQQNLFLQVDDPIPSQIE